MFLEVSFSTPVLSALAILLEQVLTGKLEPALAGVALLFSSRGLMDIGL